ncbi:hypothetical protein DL93DRAFT_2165119 [Clavulina sp. PMI_390]|nr:hypothetical protein DL93DRAFT_2165119 [Clavulina sp. PMI_390]
MQFPDPNVDPMMDYQQAPHDFDNAMPASPSTLEAGMSSFRTMATPPYEVPKPKREKLTRSREGCLTCRVRRKKCTGMPDGGGACDACQRLAIECLGYSAKRPLWMQNSEQLAECRREIRLWLAERGKGPRAVELLSLAKYYGDEPPQVPPPAPMVHLPPPPVPVPVAVSVPQPPTTPQQNILKPKGQHSTERRTRRMENAMSWVEEEDELDGEDEDGDAEIEEMMLHDERIETMAGSINLTTPTLIPTAASVHHGGTSTPGALSHHASPAPGVSHLAHAPARHTDLSQAYRWNFLDNDMGGDAEGHPQPGVGVNETPVISLVSMWSSTVRPFEHRFANPKYFQELCQILEGDPDVQSVTRNLAAIHGFNLNFGQLDAPEVKTARVELTKVQTAVKAKLLDDSRTKVPTVGHALAAIFGISHVLFTGGVMDWNLYLEVACSWLDRELPTILQGSAVYPYATAFLAETTIWMDILGSVSLQHAPKLHKHYIRSLGNDENAENAYGLFLSRIMGCENRVMLGIATISALAGWKQQQTRLGTLDTHELSDKARSIELAYLSPPKTNSNIQLTTLAPASQPDLDVSETQGIPLSYEKPIDRPGVTAAFRAAAKVYLHTVVSGAFPNSDSVSKAVDDAIEVFRGLDERDCDRALVFALTMIGCVVKDESQRDFIRERFTKVREGGNRDQAAKLVEEVWKRREAAGPQNPIEWTSISADIGGGGCPILLA